MSHPDRTKSGETPRAAALDLLVRIDREGAFADRLLAGKRLASFEPRDRSFIRELVLGTLRWQLRLDRTIDMYYTKKSGLQPEVRCILRMGLYQVMFMDAVPDFAAVSESVDLARGIRGGAPAGLVNAVLRRYLREGEPAITTSQTAERLSIEHSYPAWLVKRWLDSFGEHNTVQMLAAGNGKHPVTLRANTLRIDAEGLCAALGDAGYHAVAVETMPGYVALDDAGGVFETAVFSGGLATAQDPAAGMASYMLDPKSGERILDLCAAPGGKTTHIAELTGDSAVIDAVDIKKNRLGLVKQAAERLGISSLRYHVGDAVSFVPPDGGMYDRVLCDVPCTGTGVFSKRPDMKWGRTKKDIKRLASIQRDILENAWALTKSGGIVVYSTCTMEHEENQDRIEAFCQTHHAELITDSRFGNYDTGHGCLILPHRMGGIGAFAAKLRKLQ